MFHLLLYLDPFLKPTKTNQALLYPFRTVSQFLQCFSSRPLDKHLLTSAIIYEDVLGGLAKYSKMFFLLNWFLWKEHHLHVSSRKFLLKHLKREMCYTILYFLFFIWFWPEKHENHQPNLDTASLDRRSQGFQDTMFYIKLDIKIYRLISGLTLRFTVW